eukprot:1029110-Alexandrium_andersonii.AAC.1
MPRAGAVLQPALLAVSTSARGRCRATPTTVIGAVHAQLLQTRSGDQRPFRRGRARRKRGRRGKR